MNRMIRYIIFSKYEITANIWTNNCSYSKKKILDMQDWMTLILPYFHLPNSTDNKACSNIDSTEYGKHIIDKHCWRKRNKRETCTRNCCYDSQSNLTIDVFAIEKETNLKLNSQTYITIKY